MGDIYTNPPQSRNEAILRATIDGTEYTDPPQSRIEDLLLELKEIMEKIRNEAGIIPINVVYGGYNADKELETGSAYGTYICTKIDVSEYVGKKIYISCNSNRAWASFSGFTDEDNITIGQKLNITTLELKEYTVPDGAKWLYISSNGYNICVRSKLSRDSKNNLTNKKFLLLGDSYARGHTLKFNQVWGYFLAESNNMLLANKGQNGTYLSDNGNDSVYRLLCDSTSGRYINKNQIDPDYILIISGTNDCHNEVTIGNDDSTDPTEFKGALNLICSELRTRFPNAKVGFITPADLLYDRASGTSKDYAAAMVAICEKYQIKVLNNTLDYGIDLSNATQKATLTLNDVYGHLNVDGMKYITTRYESFIRSL